jgi:ribosomal protein S19E (S16A)
MKKSVNGYFKFYNGHGLSCRIKCDKEINGQTLIKFKHRSDSHWLYHVPNKTFRNCLEVANFILKNLENDGMVFKITGMKRSISHGEAKV